MIGLELGRGLRGDLPIKHEVMCTSGLHITVEVGIGNDVTTYNPIPKGPYNITGMCHCLKNLFYFIIQEQVWLTVIPVFSSFDFLSIFIHHKSTALHILIHLHATLCLPVWCDA